MNVTELNGNTAVRMENIKITDEEMQREYNYMLAEEMTGKLLKKGLISENEYEKIMEKNKKSFPNINARILR